MTTTILTTLVEEKRLMRYLKSVADRDEATVREYLARCVYWATLTALTPLATPEEQQIIARLLATGSSQEQQAWLLELPEEVQEQISEVVDRIFLSLEKKV